MWGPERRLYDAFGNAATYIPAFHVGVRALLTCLISHISQRKRDQTYAVQLMNRVEQDFTPTGAPLHVADPDHSLIRVMSCEEFYSTPIERLHSLHARQHLVVTGLPQEDFGFDKDGLLTLAPPEKTISIQGTLQPIHWPLILIMLMILYRSFNSSRCGSNSEVQVWDYCRPSEEPPILSRQDPQRAGLSPSLWRRSPHVDLLRPGCLVVSRQCVKPHARPPIIRYAMGHCHHGWCMFHFPRGCRWPIHIRRRRQPGRHEVLGTSRSARPCSICQRGEAVPLSQRR